jgi:hypothetical protein
MSEKNSFSVKSSHMFINPSVEETTKSYFDKTYLNTSTSDKTTSQTQPRTSTDTKVFSGSQNGMAVRTTNMGLSDYY